MHGSHDHSHSDGHQHGGPGGHSHAAGHSHAPKDFGRAFLIGITLNTLFIVIEAAYGYIANSMALIADAGHNLSDVLGLIVAWGAAILVKRPPSERYTYGLKSSSILAALANAVLLLVAVGAIASIAPVATQRIVTIASPSSMPRLFKDFGRLAGLGPSTQSALEGEVVRVAGHPLVTFECRDQLRATPIPTLVIHDEDDREVDPAHARLTAEAGPHVQLRLTQGLGHRRILTAAAVAHMATEHLLASSRRSDDEPVPQRRLAASRPSEMPRQKVPG